MKFTSNCFFYENLWKSALIILIQNNNLEYGLFEYHVVSMWCSPNSPARGRYLQKNTLMISLNMYILKAVHAGLVILRCTKVDILKLQFTFSNLRTRWSTALSSACVVSRDLTAASMDLSVRSRVREVSSRSSRASWGQKDVSHQKTFLNTKRHRFIMYTHN